MTDREQEPLKKYLTNSEKSVYNLTWETGGIAQKYYQRSRSRSYRQTDTSPLRTTHTYKPQPRPQKPPKGNDQLTDSPKETTEPIAYYYLHAYPRMLVHEPPPSVKVLEPQRSNRTRTKPEVKRNEKSSHLKIEHHFVDSPHEARKVIEDLRQKGFIEIGHHTLTSSTDYEKKSRKKFEFSL